MMLNGTFSLWDIEDVEAFCRAVIHDHLTLGVRRANGYTGPSALSQCDQEDLLSFLVATTWEYSRKYHGVDDGRGKLRFSGFVIGILHRRIVDWKRSRWKSTRYLTTAVTETPYDDELNAAVHRDEDLIGIDPESFSPRARHAYRKVCLPLAESGLEPAEFAARSSQSLFWVMQALRIVKDELEAQGIKPSVMPLVNNEMFEEAVA